MDYLLSKGYDNGRLVWVLSQGAINRNVINVMFKSAESAYNYATKSTTKKHKVFYVYGRVDSTEQKIEAKKNKKVKTVIIDHYKCIEVTKKFLKTLDYIPYFETIKKYYPEVKSVNLKSKKTTVTLYDGRVGVSNLHKGDVYTEELGFMYAYKNARTKLTPSELLKKETERISKIDFDNLKNAYFNGGLVQPIKDLDNGDDENSETEKHESVDIGSFTDFLTSLF